jgi:adenine deaminase
MENLHQKLAVARGDEAADLVFRNSSIVNVLSGELHEGDVAVFEGRIVGIGSYEGREVVDLQGKYLLPAFIDGHIHIESSMLAVHEFARAVVPHGTAGCVVDPHEFVNVLGVFGLEYMLYHGNLPLELFVMIPSCVPATHLETAGGKMTAAEILLYINHTRVAGIAEMMNYPAVYSGKETELAKIEASRGKVIDGHAPGLSGKALNAYVLAGISSDHECTTLEEAREKLRLGMHVLLREGSAGRNLRDLLPLVSPRNAFNLSFATDDKHPADLEDEGHIDHHIREAIAFGIDPIIAIQMGSINTARHYRLHGHGAIAPGYWANLVLCSDLRDLRAEAVYHRGEVVARDGEALFTPAASPDLDKMRGSIRVGPFWRDSFAVPTLPDTRIKVIDIVPGQILTRASIENASIDGDQVIADVERDILKLVVMERHNATGNIGIGFVRGFNLKRGALASTVAHDAHNIIIVGTNDLDMYAAALEVIRMDGGQCVVNDTRVVEALPLPFAGLVSDQPLVYVRNKVDALTEAAHALGCTLPDPFMTLSFLALSPIPALKVTDLGLVDSEKFELTSLFV